MVRNALNSSTLPSGRLPNRGGSDDAEKARLFVSSSGSAVRGFLEFRRTFRLAGYEMHEFRVSEKSLILSGHFTV